MRRRRPDPEIEARRFGDAHPPGTPVRYWTGVREGEGTLSRTRSFPGVTCGTAVVFVEGHGSCIALTHIEVVAGEEAAR